MKRWMRFMVLAVIPAVVLTSCDEDDDDNLPVQEEEAMVMVVHASPDAGTVNLLVDNQAVGSGLSYPSNTGYLEVESGMRNIKVNAGGATVIEENLTLEEDQHYSVFAAGTADAQDNADLELVVLEDDLTAPASGSAKIRFVHLSPDAPAVDIVNITDPANEAVVFNAQTYANANGSFTTVPAGTYSLEVRLDADDTVVPLPGLTNLQLESGKIYTVFAKGYVTAPTGNTNTLGVEIIEHETM